MHYYIQTVFGWSQKHPRAPQAAFDQKGGAEVVVVVGEPLIEINGSFYTKVTRATWRQFRGELVKRIGEDDILGFHTVEYDLVSIMCSATDVVHLPPLKFMNG